MILLLLAWSLTACLKSPPVESPFAGETVPTAPPRPTTTTAAAPRQPSGAIKSVSGNLYYRNHRYDVWIPTQVEAEKLPLFVVVHGDTPEGAAGMEPLAERLATAGFVVMVIDIDTPLLGARHPDPFVAVSCALATARANAGAHGASPDDITLLGYDFGAVIAMVIGQDPSLFLSDCPAKSVPDVHRIVGISGSYDLDLYAATAGDALRSYFGGDRQEQPGLWASGDPSEYVGRRPSVPVLLVGGDLDTVTPRSVHEAWAATLGAAGVPLDVVSLDEAGHVSLIQADGQLDALVGLVTDFLASPPSSPTE